MANLVKDGIAIKRLDQEGWRGIRDAIAKYTTELKDLIAKNRDEGECGWARVVVTQLEDASKQIERKAGLEGE